MGMYTELDMAIELRKETPDEVLDILRNPMDNKYNDMRFLKAVYSAGSYYFEGKRHYEVWYDDITEAWHIQVKTNCKNYDGEIQAFIKWLSPWMKGHDYKHDESADAVVNGGDVCGYIRYEEQIVPDLIMDDGRIFNVTGFKLKRSGGE